MINLTRASIAGRKRASAPPPPPPKRLDITTLFGETDDGIFLAPSSLASLRKRINGEEPAAASDDLIGVAITLERRLALGAELIVDPDLAASTGWTGQIGGPGEWSFAPGSFSIAGALAGKGVYHESRGVVAGALYDFQLDLTRSAGSFGIRLGSTAVITNTSKYSASGNYVWTLMAGGVLDTIRVVAVDTGSDGSFSRISVRRCLGRYGRATSDAERPILKQDGDAWYFNRPGSESLKLWGGALSGCTVCYTNENGVTLLEDQTVGADYELLKGERTYGIVVIDRALTTQEKADLQSEMALLATGGVDLPVEPDPVTEWVALGSTSKTTFRNFVEGPVQYDLRATGSNAAVYTWSTSNVAAETVAWADHGLTTPVVVEIEGAALVDTQVTHFSIGANDLDGVFPPVAGMTGLSQLYMARNQKPAPVPDIGTLSSLEVFWAHDNGATGWAGSSVPSSLLDLKLYGNAFNQETVDAVLAQCNAASLGAGVSIDIGGTNASPSNAGWASRDALIARGATVVVSGEDPRVDTPLDYKWFPGHYHFIGNNTDVVGPTQEIAPYPIVRGLQVLFYWNALEPGRNSYDFSSILMAADYLHSLGKKLVVQIQFKTFNNTKPFPSYLMTSEFEGGVYEADKGGWNLRLWHSGVRTRFNALMTALAAACDVHPAIAAMNLAESAAPTPVSTDSTAANWTYYKAQHAVGLMEGAVTLTQACSHTPTIAYFNGGASDGVAFGSAADTHGLGLGGPDTYIGAFEDNLFLQHSYDLIRNRAGQIPVLMGVQWNNYIWTGASSAWQHPDGATPVADLFAFNRDILGSNFVCWQKRVPYWTNVLALWDSLPATYPDDPAGGLPSAFPTLLKE